MLTSCQAFRDEFSKVQAAIADHDFEVTLAVAISAGIQGTHDDETDADAFFREHGFEHVDADAQEGDDERDAAGVHRIVDALSTIIWPSMARKGTQRASRIAGGPHIVLDPRSGGEADTLLSFLAGAGGPAPRTRADEVAALERWLEDDDEDDHVQSPLSAGAEGGLVPPHPSWTHFQSGSTISLHRPVPEPSASSFIPPVLSPTPPADEPAHGFEDDFSDFVTAPADEGYGALADSDDDALPPPHEIVAASARIFGPGGHAPDEDAPGADFDIAHAFSALQAMRDEISAISDDDERRRAAARVALGFAHGLDLGDGARAPANKDTKA